MRQAAKLEGWWCRRITVLACSTIVMRGIWGVTGIGHYSSCDAAASSPPTAVAQVCAPARVTRGVMTAPPTTCPHTLTHTNQWACVRTHGAHRVPKWAMCGPQNWRRWGAQTRVWLLNCTPVVSPFAADMHGAHNCKPQGAMVPGRVHGVPSTLCDVVVAGQPRLLRARPEYFARQKCMALLSAHHTHRDECVCV